ncbi:MAG: hypothetical protein GTN80_04640 [Nitrososphaeria archaeon]|nr:hypothetical protein [Nitrososphaeria archaeon]NIQ32916.1 hypothetical protein [Nitrososphaeria archaeon]
MRSCKTCTSTHKEEIEAKILDGFPCEEISRWILEEYNEKISGQAIRNHLKYHMLPGDILPSNIILEKINQLDDKINGIRELSKLINLNKRRLADLMAHELRLGCGKRPVFLSETRRVMKELREQLSLYFKIVY